MSKPVKVILAVVATLVALAIGVAVLVPLALCVAPVLATFILGLVGAVAGAA